MSFDYADYGDSTVKRTDIGKKRSRMLLSVSAIRTESLMHQCEHRSNCVHTPSYIYTSSKIFDLDVD